jgi:hypothetical protein
LIVTGDAMCFGCSERFAPELLQEVGDTLFCRGCLGRMLRRVDERGARAPAPSATAGPALASTSASASASASGINGTTHAVRPDAGSVTDRAPVPRTAAADALCFVCGEPLDGGAGIELRGFAICAGCAGGLVGDDAPPAEPPGDTASHLAQAPPDGAGSPRAAGRAPVIDTPGTGTEWCHGCGRAMPGAGSYVLVGGRPHCPRCAAARGRRPGPVASAAPAAQAEDACDACCRPLGPAPVAETQGFRLCAACLHSDPELALALARARHQRRLARASRRVLDGDDDRDDDRGDD